MVLAALMLFWCDPGSLWKDWMVGGERRRRGREGRERRDGEKKKMTDGDGREEGEGEFIFVN